MAPAINLSNTVTTTVVGPTQPAIVTDTLDTPDPVDHFRPDQPVLSKTNPHTGTPHSRSRETPTPPAQPFITDYDPTKYTQTVPNLHMPAPPAQPYPLPARPTAPSPPRPWWYLNFPYLFGGGLDGTQGVPVFHS